jgi:hypothetical protein
MIHKSEDRPVTEPEDRDPLDRMVEAYETMLERVGDGMDTAAHRTVPALRHALERARETAVELGELTREEAERIAGYLERDVRDAAHYLADTGEELRSWFRFDLRLLEERLADLFAQVADQTSLQLREWAEAARRASVYRTGEVTGQGSLACVGCGHELHFARPGHIPPCPACQGTEFKRPVAEVDDFAEGDDDGGVDGD